VTPPMSSSVSPARQIAFRVLKRVHYGGYASDLLRTETSDLDPRDAGLAEALVFGCLRYQAQLDYLIAHFSGRPQPKLDEEVRIALRLGIFQIRYLDRVPAHAAVTESVELVKKAHKRSAAGFVNAVLRKVNRKPVEWPDRATELSLPLWILERWENQYGAETAECIARAALQEPDNVVNPSTGRQQDPASQEIVPLLDIEPGMTLLDLCAAPGNKTAQAIAAGTKVIACDRYPNRLAEVSGQAWRVVADATLGLPFNRKFDRILVDAPCSGTGTLARNPEIKWRLRPSDFERFAEVQKRMVENAMRALKPGGRLVYSTCSLEQEENQGVIADLPVKATRAWLPGQSSPGDGFFAAVITSA
jgi:16S rRNA (cytosine967-C5)-methyltransferase